MRPFWFGAGLTLRRRASTRLSTIVTTVAVAVGVGLLLIVAGVPAAMERRAERLDARAPRTSGPVAPEALVAEQQDLADGRPVTRVVVAVVREPATPPPGVERLPRPGEVVLSPALAAAIDRGDTPGLAARYAGTRLAPVGAAGLLEPDELIAYLGAEPALVLQSPRSARSVSGFGRDHRIPTAEDDARASAQVASAMVAALLAALLVVLLAVATRLAATARAGRLAAMRLAGASIRQCRMVVAGELAVATTIGTVAGAGAFLLVRAGPARWWWPAPWFPADLTLGAASLVVLLGTPVLAHLVAQVGARAALRDPFATRRRRAVPLARRARLAVSGLCLGVLVFTAFEPGWLEKDRRAQLMLAALAGFLLTLPLALPVVIGAAAAVAGHVADRLDLFLAVRRVAHEPTQATRAVVAVTAAIVIAAVVAGAFTATDTATRDALAASGGERRFVAVDGVRADGALELSQQVRSSAGVDAAVPVRRLSLVPAGAVARDRSMASPFDPEPAVWAVACPDAMAVLGEPGEACGGHRSVQIARDEGGIVDPPCFIKPCPGPGIDLVIVDGSGAPAAGVVHFPANVITPTRAGDTILGQTAVSAWIDPAELPNVAPGAAAQILVRTDGSLGAEERVRAVVLAHEPTATIRSLAAESARHSSEDEAARHVRDLGGTLALVLALAAVVVAGADALLDRRALTGSLLAVGVPSRVLRRTLSAFLLFPLVIACLTGLLVGELFSGIMDRFYLRPFAWRADLAVRTPVAGVLAGLVIVGLAWFVVRHARVADAIRRE